MTKAIETVDRFLARLEHAKKAEIAELRAIILGADAGITEHIKWNAPSFCYSGDDRVTMRLQPKDCLQLIFHRGAKVKDASGFAFEDPTGLLKWAAADRATIVLDDLADLQAKRSALAQLVQRWMQATS